MVMLATNQVTCVPSQDAGPGLGPEGPIPATFNKHQKNTNKEGVKWGLLMCAYNLTSRPWHTKGNNRKDEARARNHVNPASSTSLCGNHKHMPKKCSIKRCLADP